METGLWMFILIPVLVLLAGLVLTGLAVGGSYLINQLFGRTSGLARLAGTYPVTEPPAGVLYKGQWVAVGGVNYMNKADVGVSQEGLYLWVRPLLAKYRPTLIPWKELRKPQRTIMSWQRAVRWTVGEPKIATVVFTESLVERMAPYLSTEERQ